MRTCVVCRAKREQGELVRIRMTDDGGFTTCGGTGRSAYICPTQDCLGSTKLTDAVARAIRTRIEPEARLRLARELETCQR